MPLGSFGNGVRTILVTTKTNRIDDTFAALAERGEKALVAYVAAGDPFSTVEQTADVVRAVIAGGADLIELGVPYSDPQADGPSVQAATQRALDAGVTPPFVLDVVRRLRQTTEVPIVLMGYYNPVLKIGLEKFAREMADAGADGIIISDLPPEEAGAWKRAADAHGIATIFLLAPTSTEDRIKSVTSNMNRGFVYCVSRTGVTGARSDVPVDLKALLASIRAETDLPICVGFGISNADQVRVISAMCDGAVIGSKLVDYLKSVANDADWSEKVTTLVKEWKSGTLPA